MGLADGWDGGACLVLLSSLSSLVCPPKLTSLIGTFHVSVIPSHPSLANCPYFKDTGARPLGSSNHGHWIVVVHPPPGCPWEFYWSLPFRQNIIILFIPRITQSSELVRRFPINHATRMMKWKDVQYLEHQRWKWALLLDTRTARRQKTLTNWINNITMTRTLIV